VTIFVKNEIAEQARNSIIKVSFTKANGETRILRCTLQAEFLPPQRDIEESTTRNNPNVLAVWDIENNGWRSFRLDSVFNVEVV
jgi:hypothetical protein